MKLYSAGGVGASWLSLKQPPRGRVQGPGLLHQMLIAVRVPIEENKKMSGQWGSKENDENGVGKDRHRKKRGIIVGLSSYFIDLVTG